MIEQTLIDLTAAINRLADAYEKQNKPAKKVKTEPTATAEPVATAALPEPFADPAPEQPVLVEVAAPEPPAVEPEPTIEPEPAPAPTVTHEDIKTKIKDFRRLNAHMLSARKINHTAVLRETLDRLELANIDACPDDRLGELLAAVEEIIKPIE